MSRLDYKPNEKIIDRAVALWVQALARPKYDNGDRSDAGFMCHALATISPKNNTPERLEQFGQELKRILMGPHKWIYDRGGKNEEMESVFDSLGVDYHPDIPLRDAAERAGLKMEFPWKSHMWLGEDYVSVSWGYRSPTDYHYPLQDGRWLVTTLHGDDIPKITALVEAGVLNLDLTVGEGQNNPAENRP